MSSSTRPLWPAIMLLCLSFSLFGIEQCDPDDCMNDADGDGVCDEVDQCPGGDDTIDGDGDYIPDECDPCPADAPNDVDGDGICDGAPAVTLDGLPRDLAILQRGADNHATLRVAGTVLEVGYTAVQLEVDRDGDSWDSLTLPLAYDGEIATFDVDTSLEAGLFHYEIRLNLIKDGLPLRVASRYDIAVGELVLIQGQSNAVAADYYAEQLANLTRNEWVRSFGSSTTSAAQVPRDLDWDYADGEAANAHATVGAWGLRMGNQMLDALQLPIGLLNGSVGGTYIAQHQRNDLRPEDLNTIYGRFLYRARQSGMAESAPIMVWYQGESDGYGWGEGSTASVYDQEFDALRAAWLEDFPALQQIYVFQVRYGCGLDHPSDSSLWLLFYDEALEAISSSNLDYWAGQDWTRYEVGGVAPEGAAYFGLAVLPYAAGGVYFDDAAASEVGGLELLSNISFEDGIDFPEYWSWYGEGLYEWSEDVARSGARAMWLESGSSSALLYQLASAEPGQQYATSIWSRSAFSDTYYDVREALRRLPETYSDVSLMSTNAAPQHDGCHFYYAGYEELGDRIARLILRDFHGGVDDGATGAPEVVESVRLDPQTIDLQVVNAGTSMTVESGAAMYFRIDGAFVTDATADGDHILLTLSEPTEANTLSYTDHAGDAPDVINGAGVGLLSFVDFPISE